MSTRGQSALCRILHLNALTLLVLQMLPNDLKCSDKLQIRLGTVAIGPIGRRTALLARSVEAGHMLKSTQDLTLDSSTYYNK